MIPKSYQANFPIIISRFLISGLMVVFAIYFINFSPIKIPNLGDNYVIRTFKPEVDNKTESMLNIHTNLNVNVSNLEGSTLAIDILPISARFIIMEKEIEIFDEKSILCLETIRFYVYHAFEEITAIDLGSEDNGGALCVDPNVRDFDNAIYYDFDLSNLNLEKEIGWYSTFLYPYIDLEFEIDLVYKFVFKNRESIYEFSQANYRYNILVNDARLWKVYFEFPNIHTQGGELISDGLSVLHLKSTDYYRIVFFVVFIGIFLLITMLWFIDNTAGFVEATGALYLGLYGVQQIIIPKNFILNENNLSNYAIFILYVYLTIIIIDHAVKKVGGSLISRMAQENDNSIVNSNIEQITTNQEKYLDVKDLVNITGLHPNTIRNRARNGLIAAKKINNKWKFPIDKLGDIEEMEWKQTS